MTRPEPTRADGLPASGRAWHQSRFGGLDQGLVDRRERALLLDLLGPYRGQLERILDAPAGYGRLTELLSSLTPLRVVALDRHPARLSCVPALPQVVRVRADLEEMPFDQQGFDLVVCVRHLQHVRDAEARSRCLAHLARVAKRLLVLSYYSPGGLHGAQRQILELLKKRKRPLGFVSRNWMLRELGRLGFRPLWDRAIFPGLHAQRLLLAERI